MENTKHTAPPGEALAMRVSRNTIYLNLLLAAGKLAAGLLAHSGAMISDAVHSASDVFSTLVVMLGIRIAGKPSDAEHPYGHDRMECVVSVVLSVILLLTGLGIGWDALQKIIGGAPAVIPGAMALWAAVVSVAVKEGMYWYTISAAKKLHSPALRVDAWHHRSDALSSVGSFAGILGARLGFVQLDAVASLVICVFIAKVSVDIFRDAMERMVDKSCDVRTAQSMRAAIAAVPGVERIDLLQTRVFGAKLYVDVEISVDGAMRLDDAHTIAEQVHRAIETQFPNVKHCMVHENPAEKR